jgi:hypothetical protein
MQRSQVKRLAQPVVTQLHEWFRESVPQPVQSDHTHTWVWLMPGFELCTGCGAIRKARG